MERTKGKTIMKQEDSNNKSTSIDEQTAARMRRADAAVGKLKWLPLPGGYPEHKIHCVSGDGTKVRYGAIEMVFNDAALMDWIHGESKYRESLTNPNSANVMAYLMGCVLYGQTPFQYAVSVLGLWR